MRRARPDAWTGRYLRLRPTGDGWSLLSADGEVILRTLGNGGRQRCLEYAHELGVLSVLG